MPRHGSHIASDPCPNSELAGGRHDRRQNPLDVLIYCSADAPASLMMGSHSARSSFRILVACSGVVGGNMSIPCAAIFSRNAGSWVMRMHSALRRSTISRGVPLGTAKLDQLV